MYDTLQFIEVRFCSSSSSPVGWTSVFEHAFPSYRRLLPLQNWTRVYHTCRHILYHICTC